MTRGLVLEEGKPSGVDLKPYHAYGTGGMTEVYHFKDWGQLPVNDEQRQKQENAFAHRALGHQSYTQPRSESNECLGKGSVSHPRWW